MPSATASTPTLHPESKAFLDGQLTGAERLRWAAHPDPKIQLRKALPFLAIGIGMTLFAAFWVLVVSLVAGLLGLFAVPFVFVGVGIALLGRTMHRQATRTLYAVTDRRALIVSPKSSGWRIDEFTADEVRGCSRVVGTDGGGDIVFREVQIAGRSGRPTMPRKVGFLGVTDVAHVEQVLKRELSPSS